MKEYNPGFAFYDNFYKSIENLPIEQQKEICYAVVKYGITNEMVDAIEMPLGYSFAQAWHEAIENSVDRWILNQNKANYKIDANMSRDMLIAKLIAEGKKSPAIAKEIEEITGKKIDSSTVRKSLPWKEQNNADFAVKWLGESVKNSQICVQECDVNVNSQSQKNVQKCENFTGKEREDSQENICDPRF